MNMVMISISVLDCEPFQVGAFCFVETLHYLPGEFSRVFRINIRGERQLVDNDAPCFERSESFSYLLAVNLIALLIEEVSSSVLPVGSWSVLGELDEVTLDGEELWRAHTVPAKAVGRVIYLPELPGWAP